MANLPETPQWEDGIYQIEVSDPVLGGPDGISNRQAKQLASRTSYLKQQVEKGSSDLSEHIKAADPHTQYAPKASPTFTGNPAAPTVVKTDNSTKLANTAHVKTVVADYAPLASPALTGTPTAPTAPQTVNNTQIATTAFVKSALAALVASSPEALDTLNELAAALGNDPNFATTMTNALAGKQPLDNTLTALSGKSVAALLEYLGLGEKFQPKGNYLPFRTVNKLPGRGFTGAFSGDVNTTYVKGISVASAAGETDTGQFYVDPYAVLTVRYLNSNGAIQQNRIVGIPIGATIEWQSTAAIPENFLANDGRSFSASVYSELAKVFPGLKLPDDRGLFKRALDSGKGYDSGRTLGSVQGDAMRNLTGRFGNPTIEGGDFSEGVFRHSVNSGGRAAGAGGNSVAYSFDASRQVSTANEFRPVNKAVIYITRVI
ncbi:phage tail protein [Shigella sonnei]|uniref:phage tail protein n=1 Tax=Shigella sonnei TaxID=624 RepID=UPI00066432E1|nr:phage tail protein [Shigella sonnei]CSE59259.1 tail fiber protein [Shigella sonnei]SRQ85934.1 tail fiber protein [Shigella sonnei]